MRLNGNMRFLKLFIIPLPFILFSCDSVFKDDYTITNISSSAANFIIKENGNDIYTLSAGEKKDFTLYDYPKITIVSKAHQTYIYDNGDVNITDMEKHSLHIENQTLLEVTLTEENDLLEDYGTVLTISPESTKDSYTYGNSFIAADSKGNKRECQVTKNSNTYYLVIR